MSSSDSSKEVILRSTLPAESTEIVEPALPPVCISSPTDDKAESVLIVCPLDASRRMMASAISSEGYRVVLVDSLEEALTELEEQNITRVLIDARFSEWQIELARTIRKSAGNCSMKILLKRLFFF